MLFNSIDFIVFFPIVTFIYFILPFKYRWLWLLSASYYFYMSWNPAYAILILTSTGITYLSGILINRENEKNLPNRQKRKRIWVGLSFTINLLILFYFKYYNFFAESLTSIIENLGGILINIPLSTYLLPVGISFYTFQALSYTVDVYRGDIKAEKHFGYYALFVSFFPQLVAGPIEKSKNLLPQLRQKKEFSYERAKDGLLQMGYGFFKKVVIADRLAVVVNTIYNNTLEYSGVIFWIGTIFFAFQIYCDFSGYSDIAIGCAKIMGYDLMTNFKTPYFSKSIAEFWRRWHISLGTWFKEYLYIPLGGNRVTKSRLFLNILLVFLVSGLWHGANWTFVIWGGLHAGYQIIGIMTQKIRREITNYLKIKRNVFSYKMLQTTVTFILVCFAWIFFRANTIDDAIYITKSLTELNFNVLFDGSVYDLGLDKADFILSLVSILILLVIDNLSNRINILEKIRNENLVFRWVVYYVLIFGLIIFGYYGGYDESQFIYFQF